MIRPALQVALAALVLGISQPGPTNADEVLTGTAARLYRDLALFAEAGVLTDPAQRAFFAREAAAAGVRRIRAMTPAERPRRLAPNQTGCGRALFWRRHAVFDARLPACLDIRHLAHEIAHIRVFAARCYGHGDRFYRANYRLAARFDAAFPRAFGGSGGLRAAVLKRSRENRAAADGCPGRVSITG